jgi:hypothetical protein
MSTRATNTRTQTTAWTGWAAFGGCMMVVIGTFNIVGGIAALLNDGVYAQGKNLTVLLDLTQWGWVHLILGAAIVAVGVGLINGSEWARLPAAVLLMVNLLSQMMVLPAYPFWALLIIAFDAVVLWAVIAHGDDL